MVHPVEVTDANFEAEISNYRGVALVDFWAEWCGPCRMMTPTVAELASDFQGRAKIAKLNVDENPETASAYGIMSIPTLIIFKDGRPVDKLIGVQPKSVLTQRIEKWLQ
ncbi:MAG TPA: thioredoxin [Firmicutes bacterium]|nr:thioredoxin [Bacillota bacterium]